MSELMEVWKSGDIVIYSTAALKFFQDLVAEKRLAGYLAFNNKKETVTDNDAETVYKIKKGITFEEMMPYDRLREYQPALLKTWREQTIYNFNINDKICLLERLKVPYEKLNMDSIEIQDSPRFLRVDPKLIEARLKVTYPENLGVEDYGTIVVEGCFDWLFKEFFDFARGKSSLKS